MLLTPDSACLRRFIGSFTAPRILHQNLGELLLWHYSGLGQVLSLELRVSHDIFKGKVLKMAGGDPLGDLLGNSALKPTHVRFTWASTKNIHLLRRFEWYLLCGRLVLFTEQTFVNFRLQLEAFNSLVVAQWV